MLKASNEAINVVVGDANSDEIFQQIIKLSDSYDLIIDDGSHVSKDIITSFARYFPLLKSGGMYIIEDLHASYWKVWGGGLAYPLSLNCCQFRSTTKESFSIVNHCSNMG